MRGDMRLVYQEDGNWTGDNGNRSVCRSDTTLESNNDTATSITPKRPNLGIFLENLGKFVGFSTYLLLNRLTKWRVTDTSLKTQIRHRRVYIRRLTPKCPHDFVRIGLYAVSVGRKLAPTSCSLCPWHRATCVQHHDIQYIIEGASSMSCSPWCRPTCDERVSLN